jgi:hypothetical protein
MRTILAGLGHEFRRKIADAYQAEAAILEHADRTAKEIVVTAGHDFADLTAASKGGIGVEQRAGIGPAQAAGKR